MSDFYLPRSLDDGPTVHHPRCATTCCFRLTCSEVIQEGVAQAFRDGKLKAREECFWFQKLAALHRAEMGLEPPATAEEFLAQLRTIGPLVVLVDE